MVVLNAGQQDALRLVQEGQSIFLTGPAGAGKSTLIHAIVEWATSERIKVDVTALTGCASFLLGQKAKTLHSWAGIGIARESAEVLVANIQKSPYAKRRWKSAKLLIIDEISMMTPELFEKLDTIGRALRNKSQPWGGIQLVLCGDFFQLPPVNKGASRFVFESPAWVTANLKPVLLTQIERQTDPAFQTLLNEARVGALSAASVALLQSRKGLPWKQRVIQPTLLFSRNADVDEINEANVSALRKPLRIYEAQTRVDTKDEAGLLYEDIPRGDLLEKLIQKMDADSSYCPKLELCEGCQVMLLTNKQPDAGLVNGSRGIIVGFREDNVPIVQFLHGDPVPIGHHEWKSTDTPCLKRLQIPLRVAYAVTIHKSQGATLDCALVDIGSSTFECGQAYVALSRVRNLESLFIHNLDVSRIRADLRVVRFYAGLSASSPSTEDERRAPEELPAPQEDLQTLFETAHSSWHSVLRAWASSAAGKQTLERLKTARETVKIYPVDSDIFAALRLPLTDVKVVLLGQDPYHEPCQAMGLSFSVRAGTKLPPSLKNMRKEMSADIGSVWSEGVGDLTPWVKQGVLLLNTVLTVEEGKAASHAKWGWEVLTLALLKRVLEVNPSVQFLAWGKFAQGLCKELGVPSDQVLEAAHPSPLSASRGFFGSRPFSQVNARLSSPIDWTLV